jgi:hypothetical protein
MLWSKIDQSHRAHQSRWSLYLVVKMIVVQRVQKKRKKIIFRKRIINYFDLNFD